MLCKSLSREGIASLRYPYQAKEIATTLSRARVKFAAGSCICEGDGGCNQPVRPDHRPAPAPLEESHWRGGHSRVNDPSGALRPEGRARGPEGGGGEEGGEG